MGLRLKGLIAAPYTPMHADGSVNLPMIDRLAQSLIRNGVTGAFVCGTTGEGLSLTVAERMAVAERWVAAAGDDLKVIVSAGGNCLPDCQALAAHAQQIGACAIAGMGPCFFRPATVDDLVSFCAEVAGAAPALPFYYYHIPAMTRVEFSMVEFLERGGERIPTLNGLKYTYENLMEYGRCLALQNGRFDMLFGRDEILLAALALGAQGAIGSTYNYMAPLYQRVIAAYRAGDMATAQREQTRVMENVAALGKYGGLVAGKATMRRIGLDCGPVRLPLRDLSPEQCAAYFEELDRTGFDEYRSVVD